MATSYLTLAASTSSQIEVKRSRFRADVHPVTSEQAARQVIATIQAERSGAGHHCWAMTLGPDAEIIRYNDDGEPSGTAGAPMLEVVRGHQVGDIVAVVSRWFGGTLLGSGGLARAYSDAVREALKSASLAQRVLTQEFSVSIAHADSGRVEHELRARGVHVGDTLYGQSALIRMFAPPSDRDDLGQTLAQITGSEADLRAGESGWRTVAL
ncbi:MAG: YigZ family protein [Ornithinimicrobium sp.]